MKQYEYYLFDADGTLFNTVDLICESFNHIAKKYTGTIPPREQLVASIGSPLVYQIRDFLGKELAREEILQEYLDFQLSILEEKVTVFPGVANTLATLKERGKRLAIVTSRRKFSLGRILACTGLQDCFEVLITPDLTVKHKPDPEPVEKALELLAAKQAQTVFIGDAMFDISSGAAAGVDTVFVKWSQSTVTSLPVAPTWVIDRMQELVI